MEVDEDAAKRAARVATMQELLGMHQSRQWDQAGPAREEGAHSPTRRTNSSDPANVRAPGLHTVVLVSSLETAQCTAV